MANSNLAYDLERFEQSAPVITASPRRREKRETGVQPLKIVLLAVLFIAVTSTVLYGRVMISELNSRINTVEGDLEALYSESVRLQSELENKMSLNEVESVAVTQYGMVKPDNSQVSYVEINRQNKTETSSYQKSFVDVLIGFIEKLFNL